MGSAMGWTDILTPEDDDTSSKGVGEFDADRGIPRGEVGLAGLKPVVEPTCCGKACKGEGDCWFGGR